MLSFSAIFRWFPGSRQQRPCRALRWCRSRWSFSCGCTPIRRISGPEVAPDTEVNARLRFADERQPRRHGQWLLPGFRLAKFTDTRMTAMGAIAARCTAPSTDSFVPGTAVQARCVLVALNRRSQPSNLFKRLLACYASEDVIWTQ